MRPRFSTNCICSTSNYRYTRKVHLSILEDNHKKFLESPLSKERVYTSELLEFDIEWTEDMIKAALCI